VVHRSSDCPVVLDDRRAVDLDPLGIDRLLRPIRQLNARGDVAGLVSLLRQLAPSRERVAVFSRPDSVAAIRDLGVVIGSVKRWGVEPVSAVPELGEPLVGLGARTGMVPRDTVFQYTGWNPLGTRERAYTGHAMERSLISAVRTTLPPLVVAVELCRRLGELDPCEPEFADTVTELAPSVESLVRAIDAVAAGVTAEFFARTLRPYFAEIRVDGADYLGPAAAHIPLYMVDLALWASDHGGEVYAEFWRCSTRYGLPSWQQLAVRLSREPSAVTRVAQALARHESLQLFRSANALRRALRVLLVFRGRHLGVARRAYDEEIRLFPVGSGGGSVELLADVTTLTRDIARSVGIALDTPSPTGRVVAG
jgi:hypothetical protein